MLGNSDPLRAQKAKRVKAVVSNRNYWFLRELERDDRVLKAHDGESRRTHFICKRCRAFSNSVEATTLVPQFKIACFGTRRPICAFQVKVCSSYYW